MNIDNTYGNTSSVSSLNNFKRFKIPIIVLTLLLLGFWGYNSYQSKQIVSTISVTGVADVTAKPDTVSFVVTQVNLATDVSRGVAIGEVNIKKLIDITKESGGSDVEIKKTFYQISEATSGFSIANAFSVKTKKVENIDSLIEKLYSNGATTVSNVTFKSDDIKNVETQLRQKVFNDAKDKALRIAKSSGKRLGKIVSITDDGTSNTSSIKDMQSNDGLISISKSISVVYQLK
jgi:hypothetical protein